MDENDILKPEHTDNFFKIIITEIICAAVILLAVVTVKYFFGGCYGELEKWYNANICAETEISEVLDTSDGETNEI